MQAANLVQFETPTQAWYSLWDLFVFLGVAVGVVVISYLVYNVIRYRSKTDYVPSYETKENPHDLRFVLMSSTLSIIVLIIIGVATMNAAAVTFNPPQSNNVVHINVEGHQFYWQFIYPDGHSETNNLVVPAGYEVILNVTSGDVFHSFGISMLAIKIDAIPGRANTVWFVAPQPNVYVDAIRCYELCGVGHALMVANLTVMTPNAYQQWYNSNGGG
ncbi:MAG: cytochrome c oxidase subunit II [Nitrososphaerota archaeon]|nr:cytochrome c oxidase subunit II [Nitrososphaerota archaeon]